MSILIPAVNEACTVGAVVSALRQLGAWHEIIVIDDGSTDGTGEVARHAGATVIGHPATQGNGSAIKSGLRVASGDHVLIIDADGQHRPEDCLRLIHSLAHADLVVGARSHRTHASLFRGIGNVALNAVSTALSGQRIPDLTCGFRAAKRARLLEFVHLLPEGYSTPTTTTLAFIRAGYRVAFEPIDARARLGKRKVHLGLDGLRFCVILFRIIRLLAPWRELHRSRPYVEHSEKAPPAWTEASRQAVSNTEKPF